MVAGGKLVRAAGVFFDAMSAQEKGLEETGFTSGTSSRFNSSCNGSGSSTGGGGVSSAGGSGEGGVSGMTCHKTW